MRNTTILIIIAVLAAFIGLTIYLKETGKIGGTISNTLSSEEIGNKIITLINKDLSGVAEASLKEVVKENGLYKVVFNINDQENSAYVTLDGKIFFTRAYKLEEELARLSEEEGTKTEEEKTPASCEEVGKAANPKLEAFVMSKCPYGLQMQRVLNEAVKNIPSLVGNIKVTYMGAVTNGKITSMHGDAEAQENLRQICIREEQPDKYWKYIDCYIKKGETDSCLVSSGINSSNLSACMSDSSRGLTYAQSDFDAEAAYGVTGSPTLILNGQRVSESAFGGRTAEALKDLICCGFESQPDICSQELNKGSAAADFSETYSSNDSSGSGSESCD